jgi:hypothetical protein
MYGNIEYCLAIDDLQMSEFLILAMKGLCGNK